MDKIHQWLLSRRVVHFGDVDPAGVVYFSQLFEWSHIAWEESLKSYGLVESEIFPQSLAAENNPKVALPIIYCQANFLFPMRLGDQVSIHLAPKKIDQCTFEVQSKFYLHQKEIALAMIRHVAIDSKTRERCQIPENLNRWIESSSIGMGVQLL